MPFHLPHDGSGSRRAGPRETIALLAGLMALNAFAIDAMIPALPDIGLELGVGTENRRQLVVVAYFIGFGVGQIFWGPLADRFGRKPILVAGVALYAAFALMCAVAADFELLIAGRVAMGASAAVTRVLVTAMVRDLFEGEEMARVMSLVFMVFMLVPMLAPNVGQAILWIADWRAIFVVLAAYGAMIWLWSVARLPETLREEYRQAIHPSWIWKGLRIAARDRLSIGYTMALTAVFGALTAYISSIQQIVFDVFDALQVLLGVLAALADRRPSGWCSDLPS
jgi:MFS transporter, DHA1 family, multidrug resistance protein